MYPESEQAVKSGQTVFLMMATHILLHPFMFCNLLVPFLICPPSSIVFDILCICGYRPDQPAVFVCCFFSHQPVQLVVSGVTPGKTKSVTPLSVEAQRDYLDFSPRSLIDLASFSLEFVRHIMSACKFDTETV